MPIGRYYTIEFKNVEDILVKILIGDNTIDAETPELIPLQPSGSPLILSTFDNDEAKFTPIKGQKAQITFLSNEQYSLETFSDGPDDRFDVTVFYGTGIVFYGFLSLADNSELFVSGRNEVVLTANDKLGALKEITLTDFDGVNPIGKYKIGELLAMCLSKTGLSLQLKVINNLRHGTGSFSFEASFGTLFPTVFIFQPSNANKFYAGQRILISGTASNNVEVTVISVTTGLFAAVNTDHTFTSEADVNATFTDISSEDHIYHGTYLDAKTFEEEIGVSENCYDVLKKILGYDCFLTQYKECWWICRIDEYDSNPFYVSRFDENGLYVDSYIESNLIKTIGTDQEHWFEGEATIVQPTRPIDFDKLIFNYDYPLEIICNQSFERGDFIEDLPSEENEDGITEEVKSYTLDCWESLSKEGGGAPNTLEYYDQPQIAGVDLYVKKFYFRDEERRRELVIKAAPGSGAGLPYMKSQPFDVAIGGLINLSVNVSYSNIGGNSGYLNSPVLVELISDSGNIYFWEAYDVSNPNDKQVWTLVTTGVVPNWYLGAAIDDGQTQMSFESPPLPESGQIYIYLINQYGDEVTAHYEQPDISITPFVNGSYRLYKGRYDKVKRTETGYLAKIEDEVFMSDAFEKILKGVMTFFSNDVYQLTQLWYNAALVALGSPASMDDVKPFGEHQAYAVWNQYRLANRIFQYQFQGFGEDIPSLVHKFLISDFSSHSNDRNFLMLTKEADLMLCNMTGTMEQVYNTTEGKDYDSDHEFKYIS